MKKLLILVGIFIAVGVIAGIPAYSFFNNFMVGNEYANVKYAKPPLTITQVEKIMGNPARIEHSETTGVSGDVYYYPAPLRGGFKIVFVNGVVFSTEAIPGVKS